MQVRTGKPGSHLRWSDSLEERACWSRARKDLPGLRVLIARKFPMVVVGSRLEKPGGTASRMASTRPLNGLFGMRSHLNPQSGHLALAEGRPRGTEPRPATVHLPEMFGHDISATIAPEVYYAVEHPLPLTLPVYVDVAGANANVSFPFLNVYILQANVTTPIPLTLLPSIVLPDV